MTDKNGTEIKTGDIVEITGAYFKRDNALYFVDHVSGDPGWNGCDICLRMIRKSGELSGARYSTCFWPIKAYVNNPKKRAEAEAWNAEHAQIEVRRDIDPLYVAEHFEREASKLTQYINYAQWNFGPECEDAKRNLAIQAHLRAVAARINSDVNHRLEAVCNAHRVNRGVCECPLREACNYANDLSKPADEIVREFEHGMAAALVAYEKKGA